MDVDQDGYWSRDEYVRVQNMYGTPILNIFEKFPMNVEDAFEALFGFPLVMTISNFYEADRDNDGLLSTSEFVNYLRVAGFETTNALAFMQNYEGLLTFEQFLNLTNTLPNDAFPRNTVDNDLWGTSISTDYSDSYYYYG